MKEKEKVALTRDVIGFSRVLDAVYRSAADPMSWPTFLDSLLDIDQSEVTDELLGELAGHLILAGDLVADPERSRKPQPQLEITFDRTLTVLDVHAEFSEAEPFATVGRAGAKIFSDDDPGLERLQSNIERLEQGAAERAMIVVPTLRGFSVGVVMKVEDRPGTFRLTLIHDGDKRSLSATFEAFVNLTPAEKTVCDLLYKGHLPKQIALELNNSDNTIKTHISAIFSKVGINSQKDLIHVIEIVQQFDDRMNEMFSKTGLNDPASSEGSADAQPKKKLARPGDRVVTFRDYGPRTGHPVFYFHGLYACGLLGEDQIDDAKDAKLRMIGVDRPGYAGTSTDAPGGNIETVLDDCLAVADDLGIDLFDVLGFGLGAQYACGMGLQAPQRVGHVYLCSPGFGAGMKTYKGRSRAQLVARLVRLFPAATEAAIRLAVRSRSREDFAQSLRRMWQESQPDLDALESPVLVEHMWKVSIEGIGGGTKGVVNDIMTSQGLNLEFEKMKPPVTVWHGVHDKTSDTVQLKEHLSLAPNLTFHEFKDKGQLMFHTDFAMMAKAMSQVS